MKQKLNREQLFKKFERYTEVPMLVLVIIMIGTLVAPMIFKLNEQLELVFEVIDWIIWSAFAVELCVKTYLSSNRLAYLKKNWLDVVVVILPVLRVFRFARIVRGARALRVLRLSRVLVFFAKFTTELKTIFSRHGFNYLFVIFVCAIGLGTVLTYTFDQHAQTGINSIQTSLWLIVVNAFTGGYANVYPETPEAKTVSVILIIVGTVLASYFTASLASYFTEKGQDVEQEEIKQKLDKLIREIRSMKQNI